MSSTRTTTKKPRARTISQVEWRKYQYHIEELYVNQGKSLEKVAAVLHKRHGFDAQKCQYKAQIKRWGFKKNTSRTARSRVEYDLSMQPSKEQREYWSSDHMALLPLDTLGYHESLGKLVLLNAADEMLLEGNSDLVEHLERKDTAPREQPYNFTQISDDSPTGLILRTADLNHRSWSLVFFYSAKIASIVPATDLIIPTCTTPEHHCCPEPTWMEERFSPQCQQFFKQSTMMLLLGLLFAADADLRFGGRGDEHILRSALGSVERQFHTAMKHAKRLKRKVERRSESDMDIEFEFLDWREYLSDSLVGVMGRGFVMECRDLMW